jgi:uncharacterized membrane protein YgaE (UPF0421/DUF939 family)
MEQIIDVIVNNGVAIAVVLYFIWKDSTLTKENTSILEQVKSLLEILVKEGGEEYETK